jgi:hypothetical protein
MQIERLRTLECAVKQETANADEDISKKGNDVDGIMAVSQAVPNTSESKTQEQKISEGVDDFGRIGCCVVVLAAVLLRSPEWRKGM